jgi:hypothetical protein
MAKDFLGCELNVGDPVVFAQLGYRNLLRGTVFRITPKTLQIGHKATNGGTGTRITKQFHEQVVRLPVK